MKIKLGKALILSVSGLALLGVGVFGGMIGGTVLGALAEINDDEKYHRKY